MRSVCAVAGASLFLSSLAGLAETKAACSQTLNAPLNSNALLIIESRPAGLEIVGTDQQTIHVSCTANDEDNAQRVQVSFSRTSDGGKLGIEGALVRHGNNGLQVRIEVPWKTNLRVRMLAGEVKVEEIKGDKDIELYAGQITVSSPHEWDYRSVDASVAIGEVQARVYGADKGGFFRSFTKRFPVGDYRLHAHVTTGEIDLVGKKVRSPNEGRPD